MSFDLRKLKLIRRKIYGIREFVPWLKERHRLEIMVGPLGYWNKLQAYQLNVLKKNGLLPYHKLLDIGCGPLQGGIAFIKYLENNNYYGLDNSKEVIDTAEKLIIKNSLTYKNPLLVLSETFGLNEIKDTKFNFMWSSQNLYYFNDQIIRQLFLMISQLLEDDGVFLGDIIGPSHYEFRLREHGWILHTVDSLCSLAKEFNLNINNVGEIRNFGYPPKLSLATNLLIKLTKDNK